MVKQEKALIYRGPGEDGRTWLKKLAELEVQEERLLDLYLENKLEMDRYERHLAQIYQSRIVPGHLDALEPDERNRVYKMLDLTLLAHENGSLELKWALSADLCRDNGPLPRWSFESTTNALRFRAVLTGDGSEEVELARP